MIPPGFRRSDATLQTTLDVETPSEHDSDVDPRTAACTASARPLAWENALRDGAEIEVALVEPGPLDARHDLPDRRPHRLRVLAIQRVSRPQEDGVGTAAERLGRAHRRADPEPPGRVVRGRDDAAAPRVAADDERPLPERRVLELLDRCEERVEIEMREDRHGPSKATVRP